MPVHSRGHGCYQWGHHGKVYCGPGARAKAERQGRAAFAGGYRGREVDEVPRPIRGGRWPPLYGRPDPTLDQPLDRATLARMSDTELRNEMEPDPVSGLYLAPEAIDEISEPFGNSVNQTRSAT